jgi:hypothetical protein
MHRRLWLAAALTTLLTLNLAVGRAYATLLVDRPAAELYGSQAIFGIAGSGVNSATGNYSLPASDLDFPG